MADNSKLAQYEALFLALQDETTNAVAAKVKAEQESKYLRETLAVAQIEHSRLEDTVASRYGSLIQSHSQNTSARSYFEERDQAAESVNSNSRFVRTKEIDRLIAEELSKLEPRQQVWMFCPQRTVCSKHEPFVCTRVDDASNNNALQGSRIPASPTLKEIMGLQANSHRGLSACSIPSTHRAAMHVTISNMLMTFCRFAGADLEGCDRKMTSPGPSVA